MAEIQTNTDAGETTQRFLEFVMMQSQNAALFLGQIPNPQGEAPEVNLDLARMFIDQLAMIRVKTKGNLTTEEQGVLNNALSQLQMMFYEVSQGRGGDAASASPEPVAEAAPAASPELTPAPAPAPAAEGESKKKFTKSYGA